MTDYAQFKYSATSFPIATPAAGASLLSTCDPVIAKLLDFIGYRIQTYVGGALVAASGSGNAPITASVGSKVPIDPVTIAKVEQFKFPILAIWRKTSKYDQRTTNWDQETSRVGIAYILPPLTAAQSSKLQSVLVAVGRVVHTSFAQGFDPGYNSGERVFSTEDTARSRLMSAEYAHFPFEGNTDFHAWIGEAEIAELTVPDTDNLHDFTGTDTVITDESVEPGNPIDVVDLALGEP